MLLQIFHNLGNSRFLLPYGYVYTLYSCVLLSDDSINAYRRLPDLTVADYKLSLPPSDRCHCIYSLYSCIHGFVNRLPLHDTRGDHFYPSIFVRLNWSFPVKGCASGVNDTAEQGISYRNLGNSACSFYYIPFLNVCDLSQYGNTHIISLQIEHHTEDAAGKFEQFH